MTDTGHNLGMAIGFDLPPRSDESPLSISEHIADTESMTNAAREKHKARGLSDSTLALAREAMELVIEQPTVYPVQTVATGALEIEVDHKAGTVRVFVGDEVLLYSSHEATIYVRERYRNHRWCECGHSIHEGDCTIVTGDERCSCDEFTPEGMDYRKKLEHRLRNAISETTGNPDHPRGIKLVAAFMRGVR